MEIYFGCILSDEKHPPSNSNIILLSRKPYTGDTHYYSKHWNLIALTEQGYQSQGFREWILANTLHSSSLIRTHSSINDLQTLHALKEETRTLFALKTPQGYSDPEEVKELNLLVINYIHHALCLPQPDVNTTNMRSFIFKLIKERKDILTYL